MSLDDPVELHGSRLTCVASLFCEAVRSATNGNAQLLRADATVLVAVHSVQENLSFLDFQKKGDAVSSFLSVPSKPQHEYWNEFKINECIIQETTTLA